MDVQDLWDMYEGGLDPSDIERIFNNVICSDSDLIEAMIEIWSDYDDRMASGEFEDQ